MLWGALNNSSTAMMAMSTDMGSISQNISNVNTTGYKRTETMFKTMMSGHHAAPNTYVGGLNIFGVQAVQRNHIQAQGIIQPSSTWSDLAINGSGFFMVAPPVGGGEPTAVDLEDPNSVLYTRDGSWQRTSGPDTDPNLARNYFTTSAGAYLMGWMADADGNFTAGGQLEPVYTLAPRPIPNNGTPLVDNASTLTPSSVLMPGRATTSVSVLANIPSGAAASSGQFTQTVTATDPNTATDYDLTLSWTRVDGNTWTVTPSVPAAAGSVTSAPVTVEVDSFGVVTEPAPGADLVDISWLSGPATSQVDLMGPDTDLTTSTVVDPLGIQQQVDLTWTRVGGNVWEVTPSLNVPTLGTLTGATTRVTLDSRGRVLDPSDSRISMEIDWDDGSYGAAAETSNVSMNLNGLVPDVSLGGPIPSLEKIPVAVYDENFNEHVANLAFERTGTNTWYMHVQSGDGGLPSEPIALVFDGAGKLTSPAGGIASVPFNWIDDTGATITSTVTVDISKLSQFDGSSLYIGNVSTDGYGEGTLNATAFNEMGELEGYYSNGRSRVLFKVPVANFVSDNMLDPVSGNLFRRTAEAGALTVSAIDEAPGEGRFATSSLESSTVQIEDEFTRMIMTQKAYSSNAQVFKTADEMTSTARDLKR